MLKLYISTFQIEKEQNKETWMHHPQKKTHAWKFAQSKVERERDRERESESRSVLKVLAREAQEAQAQKAQGIVWESAVEPFLFVRRSWCYLFLPPEQVLPKEAAFLLSVPGLVSLALAI